MTSASAHTVLTAAVAAEEVVGIKGFEADWTCRGFQFEPGKTYEHDGPVVICQSGFHAISGHPLEVLRYYAPAKSRYAEVRQSGSLARHGEDSKVASGRITIGAEIHVHELAQRAVKWVFGRANWKEGPVATKRNEGATASGNSGAATASGDYGAATASGYCGAATASGNSGAATASGYCGAATASGYCGAATASGNYGAATASGYCGAATASGNCGAATASGYCGAATASGYYGAATASGDCGAATASGNCSAATASGFNGEARGAKGCALFLVNRDRNSGAIRHAWAGIVGQDEIKPDTFYRLGDDGKPVECE